MRILNAMLQGLVFFLGTVYLFSYGTSSFSEESTVKCKTYTYKTVNDLEIKADVYRTDDTEVRPVVISIHGGALIFGHRGWIDETMKKLLLDDGYAIVSIDYRLAPETKLPDIIEDIEDAYAWVLKKGPELFHVDTRRIAVIGSSAGGYLTLTAGYRCNPRPAVLVSFFGYGDLIGDWYSTPSKHKRHHTTTMTENEAWEQVNGPAISDSRDRIGNGGGFYQYCRQHGLWPHAVSGWDPQLNADLFYKFMPLKNVSEEYPPTLLLHGTVDTDVPYDQSVMMSDELAKHHVEHELVTIVNGEHGFYGGDPEHIEQAYKAAFRFLNDHMK